MLAHPTHPPGGIHARLAGGWGALGQRAPPTHQAGNTPPRGVARPPGGQRPISLEYQIYLPAIDTIVTGLSSPSNIWVMIRSWGLERILIYTFPLFFMFSLFPRNFHNFDSIAMERSSLQLTHESRPQASLCKHSSDHWSIIKEPLNAYNTLILIWTKPLFLHFLHCSKRLWPRPLPFEHLVDFFVGLGGTMHWTLHWTK